jgi:hypothetical protein
MAMRSRVARFLKLFPTLDRVVSVIKAFS